METSKRSTLNQHKLKTAAVKKELSIFFPFHFCILLKKLWDIFFHFFTAHAWNILSNTRVNAKTSTSGGDDISNITNKFMVHISMVFLLNICLFGISRSFHVVIYSKLQVGRKKIAINSIVVFCLLIDNSQVCNIWQFENPFYFCFCMSDDHLMGEWVWLCYHLLNSETWGLLRA